ncbi:MAG: sulfurtransferase [Bacillales bacterium]|jgi:rhodanese-related sulfurtransferase|nr:sulfurtransferase [Bacillales bacterium]
MFFFNKKPSMSTTELQQILSEKPTILDVREPFEFVGGHIPGAKNVPLGTVLNYTGKKEEKMYIICLSGMRSKRASDILISKGYNAINVKGGMMNWRGPLKGGNK